MALRDEGLPPRPTHTHTKQPLVYLCKNITFFSSRRSSLLMCSRKSIEPRRAKNGACRMEKGGSSLPFPRRAASQPGLDPLASSCRGKVKLPVGVGNPRVLGHDLVVAAHQPPCRHQALHTDRPAGVYAARADANLGSKTKAEAVGEPRRCVVVNACAVYHAQEVISRSLVFSQDALRVAGAVHVDVRNRFIYVLHNLDCQVTGSILVAGGGRQRQAAVKGRAAGAHVAAVHSDASLLQGG
mmetsp:Transcript_22104/g.61355  ORF Transcript_22104/g.61355 Transcript_22104/m.61355 type:complete len:241 (-) Transcript_22104:1728-2450(-)